MDTLEYPAYKEDKTLKELEAQLEQQTKELNQALNSIAELGDQAVPFPVEMLKELEELCQPRVYENSSKHLSHIRG